MCLLMLDLSFSVTVIIRWLSECAVSGYFCCCVDEAVGERVLVNLTKRERKREKSCLIRLREKKSLFKLSLHPQL